jgi:hypothetical protein
MAQAICHHQAEYLAAARTTHARCSSHSSNLRHAQAMHMSEKDEVPLLIRGWQELCSWCMHGAQNPHHNGQDERGDIASGVVQNFAMEVLLRVAGHPV